MNNKKNNSEALAEFDKLLTMMGELRERCPWDRKQTFETLKTLTIEEVYELTQAIDDKSMDEVKKELGDLLLHIVFYSYIANETQSFNIADVIRTLCEKLVRRHPHIYGEVKVDSAKEVRDNWEQIKMTEGRKSALEGVPHSLPALIKAYRIQDKASGLGFDWDNAQQVWDKVEEEVKEMKEEIANGNKEKTFEEFGDVFFALINYSRFIGVNPENALEHTNRKFIKRFQYLETASREKGLMLKDMTLAQMEELWCEAKKED
jgi:XTP/dITP diphosphohydrolase